MNHVTGSLDSVLIQHRSFLWFQPGRFGILDSTHRRLQNGQRGSACRRSATARPEAGKRQKPAPLTSNQT